MNEISRLSMIVSMYFLQRRDFSCACFLLYRRYISYWLFPFWGNFELKVIPFWYRLSEPMTEQIGCQVLIQTLG